MNISYLLYQAERPRSAAEQREADVQAGELAACAARLGHSLRHPFTGGTGQAAQRAARAAALATIPRPRVNR
jgi:hypothetical protein